MRVILLAHSGPRNGNELFVINVMKCSGINTKVVQRTRQICIVNISYSTTPDGTYNILRNTIHKLTCILRISNIILQVPTYIHTH